MNIKPLSRVLLLVFWQVFLPLLAVDAQDPGLRRRWGPLPPDAAYNNSDIGPTTSDSAYGQPPVADDHQIATRQYTAKLMEQLLEVVQQTQRDCGVKPLDQSNRPWPPPLPVYDQLDFLFERFSAGDTSNSLTYLLLVSEQPSLTGVQNRFVQHTKQGLLVIEDAPTQTVSRELALAMRVLKHPKPELEPPDLLRLSLDVCSGDLPSALLTCHNFCKELAYAGRGDRIPQTFQVIPFPADAPRTGREYLKVLQDYQEKLGGRFQTYEHGDGIGVGLGFDDDTLTRRFRSLRVAGDPHSKDRLGPWYHIFGPLYVSTEAEGGRYTAEAMATGEGLLRHMPFFSSPEDYFKEYLTVQAGRLSGKMLDIVAKAPENCAGRTRLIGARGVKLTRHQVPPAPGRLASAFGSFPDQPVDEFPNVPIVIGPFPVAAGGQLVAEITVGEPVPQTFSLGNNNTGITINYRPRLANGFGPPRNVAQAAPGVDLTAARVSGTWDGPGELTVTALPPGGSGPLIAKQYGQGFALSVTVEKYSATSMPESFVDLDSGDRLEVEPGGQAVLKLPDGSRAMLSPGTAVRVRNADDGHVELRLERGQIFGYRAADYTGSHVVIVVDEKDGWKVRAEGTEYDVSRTEADFRVRLRSGAVEVSHENQPPHKLQPGQQFSAAADAITRLEPAATAEPLVDGLPLGRLLLDDQNAEPYGTVHLEWSAAGPGHGWAWEDPGEDASVETAPDGTLHVSVPDGNEFWDRQSNAPRLLHRVAGDFDLSANLLMTCNGNHFAATEFVCYAPGYSLGQQANQYHGGGMAAHYQLLGGGIVLANGHRFLATFDQSETQAPAASSEPVPVRLTRRGNVWSTYWSPDGKRWVLSGRKKVPAPDTVWVGWLMKRIAHDGLRDQPAVSRFGNITLTSAPRGSLPIDAWEFLGPLVRQENESLELAVDQTKTAQTHTVASAPLCGDFDVVIHFDSGQWEHKAGQSRCWVALVTDFERQQEVYVGGVCRDASGLSYVTDQRHGTQWRQYAAAPTADHQGWLRITRTAGIASTWYWSGDQWTLLGSFPEPLKGTMYLGLRVNNDWDAQTPVAFTARFRVEDRRLLDTLYDEAGRIRPPWNPVNQPDPSSSTPVTAEAWGFAVGPLPPATAATLALADIHGVVVRRVTAESPAAAGGLRIGDILLQVNRRDVPDENALNQALARVAPSGTAALRLIRQGVNRQLTLSRQTPPPSLTPVVPPPPPTVPTVPPAAPAAPPIQPPSVQLWTQQQTGQRVVLGLSAVPAGGPDAHRLGVETPTGAVLATVQPNSAAQRAGLRPGDVIVQFNGREINCQADLEAAVLASVPGSRVMVSVTRGTVGFSVTLALATRTGFDTRWYAHPSGGFQLQIPLHWKAQLGRDSTTTSLDLLSSFYGEYRLYCQPRVESPTDLQESLRRFVESRMRQNAEVQQVSERIGHEWLVGTATLVRGERVYWHYHLAMTFQERLYVFQLLAPPMVGAVPIPAAIRDVLKSVQPCQPPAHAVSGQK